MRNQKRNLANNLLFSRIGYDYLQRRFKFKFDRIKSGPKREVMKIVYAEITGPKKMFHQQNTTKKGVFHE